MEDVLDTYCLPYDEKTPLICMDEKPYQLLDDILAPIPMKAGKNKKIDYEYERKGTSSIFIFAEPLKGVRYANAREQRTKKDWAEEIHKLLTVHYPNASKIRLVADNLNTHTIGALYETYPPEIARALASRLEIHYTPKHASRLNIAEIELSVMERQCLKRRLPDIETLNKELTAWQTERNKNQKKVDWQFTTKDARVKLKHLYPSYTNI
jgi:hypothetical protein